MISDWNRLRRNKAKNDVAMRSGDPEGDRGTDYYLSCHTSSVTKLPTLQAAAGCVDNKS